MGSFFAVFNSVKPRPAAERIILATNLCYCLWKNEYLQYTKQLAIKILWNFLRQLLFEISFNGHYSIDQVT